MKSTAGVRFADKVHKYSRVRNKHSLTFINFPWVTFLWGVIYSKNERWDNFMY